MPCNICGKQKNQNFMCGEINCCLSCRSAERLNSFRSKDPIVGGDCSSNSSPSFARCQNCSGPHLSSLCSMKVAMYSHERAEEDANWREYDRQLDKRDERREDRYQTNNRDRF